MFAAGAGMAGQQGLYEPFADQMTREANARRNIAQQFGTLFFFFSFITLEPRVEWYTIRYPLFIFLLLSSLDLSDAKVFEP